MCREEKLVFPPKDFFVSTGNKAYDILVENIDRLKKNNFEYAVWGTGQSWHLTKDSIEKYTGERSREKYLVDNNPAMCDGEHILTPDQFKNHMHEIDTVFVCVYVADIIKNQLIDMGYQGRIVPMVYATWIQDYFRKQIEYAYDNYKLTFDMMFDEKSKRTIVNWLMGGLNGDISLYEEINGDSKYKLMEQNILRLTDNECFIDVGAYTGDTVETFLEATNSKYKSIVAIEADKRNYTVLNQNISRLRNTIGLNLAIGDYDGTTQFLSGQSESSFVTDRGDEKVDIRTLDSIAEVQSATFIKISANCLEHKIIAGAKELICRNKPKLAYYCSDEKKWTIPLMLREWVPEYKFYIRHYGVGHQAVIGYAVCE